MTDAELNDSVPSLNESCGAADIMSVIDGAVEVGASFAGEVKTVLGRIGGISVAAVIFDGRRRRSRTHCFQY